MLYRFEAGYEPSRDAYLVELAKGKNVLHIGACDAPYTRQKKEDDLLLHAKLDAVASNLLGIDIDSDAIELMKEYGYSNIFRFDMNNLDELDFQPDVVIFGETIEHLVDFSSAFTNLKKIMVSGTILVVSTPNALSWSNFLNALSGIERVHEDHTVAFTPRTLEKMIEANGLTVTKKIFTFLDRKKERWPKKLQKAMLSRFPLLSGTLLYECRLP